MVRSSAIYCALLIIDGDKSPYYKPSIFMLGGEAGFMGNYYERYAFAVARLFDSEVTLWGSQPETKATRWIRSLIDRAQAESFTP